MKLTIMPGYMQIEAETPQDEAYLQRIYNVKAEHYVNPGTHPWEDRHTLIRFTSPQPAPAEPTTERRKLPGPPDPPRPAHRRDIG